MIQSVCVTFQMQHFHDSTDRTRCATKAPSTDQTQTTKSVFTAQEGSIASQCAATDADQTAPKQRAGTHGVVLISITALFGVPRLRDPGSARHDRRLKAELQAIAPRRPRRRNFSPERGKRPAGDRRLR